jgi:hypothetical protein
MPGGSPDVSMVLQPLLQPLAAKHAPGARPEGAPQSAMLQQGQSMQLSAQLAPGGSKCYTVIAVGAVSVTEIQVDMVLNLPMAPPAVVAQTQTATNPAVMAGSPNCFKNLAPIPGPVVIKVTARAGTGPVMAQLYAR